MYITDIVYLLDVLVVILVYMSYHDTAIVGIIYYCTRIGVSVLRTGRGRAGGGGEVEFLTEKKISLRNVPEKCSWDLGGGGGPNFFFSLLNLFFSKMFLGF